jgi:beta-galactosidase
MLGYWSQATHDVFQMSLRSVRRGLDGICLMTHRLRTSGLIALLVLAACQARSAPAPLSSGQRRVCIDADWRFEPSDVAGADQVDFDDAAWQSVNLPHDWTAAGPFSPAHSKYNGYLPRGLGWYRKHLTLDSSFAGRQVYLEFEGVFRNSTFWVNGRKAGTHASGYTGAVYDLTPYLHCDGKENILAMRVDGRRGEGWWYEGCGIYRHVWLINTDNVHVANWGTFVTTPEVSEAQATIHIRTTVQNDSPGEQGCLLQTQILDPQGQSVGRARNEARISLKSASVVTQEVTISNPRLWSPDSPSLYRVRTRLLISSNNVDATETPFGIRWFEFTADRGFFLNGRHLQLRGACIHHDFGGLGVALPDRANEKTVEVLKRMGCNFLRSSHNDAAPSLVEACDRLGLLVWAETRYLGPARTAGPPLRDLIRRNRNHPSIICWSLANTAGSTNGVETEYLKELNRVAHEEDLTRPTAFACEGNADANANGFALVTDIMGYNGGGMGIDDRDHRLYPRRKMLVSEFSSGRGARGVYQERAAPSAPVETLGDGRTMRQAGQYFSIYNLCRSHEAEWSHIAKRPWLAGGAMWSGIDYGGETAGWPIVTSQFGVLDRCRFPNDAYFYYVQEWTAQPMVHLFPHWTWPGKEGQAIELWCYSNCDTVELVLNGKSLGLQSRRPLTHRAWKVPYEPGTLLARGSVAGKVVATEELKTAGAPARIQLTADRVSLSANGTDLSFITATIQDGEGTPVPTADNEIAFDVTGAGKLIGLCSGDPASHENPKTTQMKAFNSLLLAIVQTDTRGGDIAVKASSPGLAAATLELDGR